MAEVLGCTANAGAWNPGEQWGGWGHGELWGHWDGWRRLGPLGDTWSPADTVTLVTPGWLGDTGSPVDRVSPSAPRAVVAAVGATGRPEAGRWCTAGWG